MTYRVAAQRLVFEQRLMAQTVGAEVFGMAGVRDVPITKEAFVANVTTSWKAQAVVNHTATADEHQTMFTVGGGTLTLPPAPEPFKMLEFGVLSEGGATIEGGTIIFGAASGTTLSTSSSGAFVKLILLDATTWLAYSMTGEWDLS